MSRLATVAAMLAVTSFGCGLPLGDEPIPTSNRCSDDSDCGSDGKCLVEQAICVSQTAELDELTVEIFVPSGGPNETGTSSIITLPALKSEDPNGLIVQRDLTTNRFYEVTGRLQVDDDKCAPLARADGLFPITLELRPAATLTGLSLQSFGQGSTSQQGEVLINVPEGLYDITLRPDSTTSMPDEASNACVLPPALFTNQRIENDFDINLGVLSPVQHLGQVQGLDVEGWLVDLIDGDSGRPISNVTTLGEGGPIESGGPIVTEYSLRYWQEVVDSNDGTAFLRLRPPDDLQGTGYPTLFNALELEAAFNLEKLNGAKQIRVQANVVDGNEGLSAQVVIQSVRFLDGEMGSTVFYKQQIPTDDDGVLDISLFTGTYTFTAIPDNPAFAATELTVELGDNDLGGKTLVLQPKTPVQGTVSTSSGAPAFGLAVSLATVNTRPTSFVASRLSPLPSSTVSTNVVTDTDGGFSFEVPPGQYDLSVRPPNESALPWAVLSRLTVDKSTPALDLSLSNPVLLFGRVRSGDNGDPIPGAVIRVWTQRINPESDEGPSVFQIGEATANGDGEYQIVLPSSLNDALAVP